MKMNYIKLLMLAFVSITMIKCEFQVTDFGFDGSIKGMVKDNSGNPLYGDISSNNLVVSLLGEGDKQAIEIRVKGDGTYQNLKMFPKKHKVWLKGPIVSSDTVSIDFGVQSANVKDFTVTPMISPKVMNGVAAGTSIKVDYSMVGNEGNTVKKKEIYCSTVPYPTAAIGSRTNVYFTKTVTLPALSGTVSIDGLETGVKYYIRVGAQSNASALMNYSNQIEIAL